MTKYSTVKLRQLFLEDRWTLLKKEEEWNPMEDFVYPKADITWNDKTIATTKLVIVKKPRPLKKWLTKLSI